MAHYKKAKFTLLDQDYFRLAGELSEQLERYGIPHAIVGGAAVQARIAHVTSEKGLRDLAVIGKCGLEARLRKTGDIDLTTLASPIDVSEVLQCIALENPNIMLDQLTEQSADFLVNGNRILINYQTQPSQLKGFGENAGHYETIIATSNQINLKSHNYAIQIRVPSVEYIIVSKLLRTQAKDAVDLHNLLTVWHNSNMTLDREKIRSILKSIGKEDLFGDFLQALNDSE